LIKSSKYVIFIIILDLGSIFLITAVYTHF
jgi:hypothetical protein